MGKIVAYWYQATCFGSPCGPWRDTIRHVHEDLIADGMGGYDEAGCFYVTVPGGIRQTGAWMDFDQWASNGRRPV